MKKITISRGEWKNNEYYHTVKIDGEEFNDVANLPKCNSCTRKTCDFYKQCMHEGEGVVRIFDCKKNAKWANNIWNLATGILVIIFAIIYYKKLSLGTFKGTAILIITMVVLDIICCGIEKLASIIRDNYFYYKLKKAQIKEKVLEERNRLEEEAKAIKEQEEADAKNPNRSKIREAETTLEQIAEISKNINFGECDEKVEFCVQKCRKIIEQLKKDTSGYIRVESLLQVYLPEFYRILAYYAEFEKAEAVEEAQAKKLNQIVDYFYNFLCKQKEEAIFDKKATEIKFNIAADTLRREIESRGGRL